MLDPHALVMFGKMSDQPADVQFRLMFPVREPQEQPVILKVDFVSQAGKKCKIEVQQ